MSTKFLGGFITKSPTIPTSSAASGMWTLDQAMQYSKAGTWPIYNPALQLSIASSAVDNFGNSGTYYSGGYNGCAYGNAINYNTPNLNSSISAVWAYGRYASRTYAPVSTVLFSRTAQANFPEGNNWESAWWTQDSNGNSDVLIVQFPTNVTVGSILIGNPQDGYGGDGSITQVYGVTSLSGNTITGATQLGSVTTPGTGFVTLFSGSATHSIFVVKRRNVSSWSRLEEVIFKS